MLAWRLCREPYADLNGEGARLYGGRWNTPGRPLIYTASTAALAVLEICVHLDLAPELLPDDYVLVTLDLDDLAVEDLTGMPVDQRAFGDAWLRERRTPVLRVPSVIVPEDNNVLVNPDHPSAAGVNIVGKRRFEFDRRLWRPL